MHYAKGYDAFSADPGTVAFRNCLVCGDVCEVTRDVDGATSWVEAVSRSKHRHDSFVCKNAKEQWHLQARALLMEMEETKSPSLRSLIRGDLRFLLETRNPFQNWTEY